MDYRRTVNTPYTVHMQTHSHKQCTLTRKLYTYHISSIAQITDINTRTHKLEGDLCALCSILSGVQEFVKQFVLLYFLLGRKTTILKHSHTCPTRFTCLHFSFIKLCNKNILSIFLSSSLRLFLLFRPPPLSPPPSPPPSN